MTLKRDYGYKCFNDCIQAGCPGHKMRIEYNSTSDMITLVTLGHKDKNNEWINDEIEVFDRNQLKALTHAFQELMN